MLLLEIGNDFTRDFLAGAVFWGSELRPSIRPRKNNSQIKKLSSNLRQAVLK